MALSRNQMTVLEALAENGGELSGLELADIIGSLARSSVYAALSVANSRMRPGDLRAACRC